MFNVGDKVRCIDASDRSFSRWAKYLREDTIYIVYKVWNTRAVQIAPDIDCGFSTDRFELVSKNLDERINDL